MKDEFNQNRSTAFVSSGLYQSGYEEEADRKTLLEILDKALVAS
jgi:hypothetical protein